MNLPSLPFNFWLLVLMALVGVLVMTVLLRAGAPYLPKRVRIILAILRILGLVALFLAVLDPFHRVTRPDPSAYRFDVLVDASRSMESPDLVDGRSRLEWVSRWLLPESGQPAWKALAHPGTAFRISLFSSERWPWDRQPLRESRPGETAIGTALEDLLESGGATSEGLGGVLLLSDGASLSGIPPATAARRFAREQIPVSVIGVGTSRVPGDLAIRFSRETHSFQRGEEAAFSVEIENTFSGPRGGSLAVYRDDRLIERRPLQLDAGETRSESFSFSPEVSRVETLRAVFEPDFTGGNPATHLDFSIADIKPDGSFRILLMADRGGWLTRILRILARENESLQMDSLIRVDEERIFALTEAEAGTAPQAAASAKRETRSEIPLEPDFYRFYDAILIDLPMALENAPSLAPVFEEFAGDKGGGLLLFPAGGSTAAEIRLPAELRTLFPARAFESARLNREAPLLFEPEPLFSDAIGGLLFSSPVPVLPADSRLAIPVELSRAAQFPVRLRDGQSPVLVTHAYGAGRTAWLGSSSLWRWRFGDERARESFTAFWDSLLAWLAVGGKERVKTPLNASVVPVDGSTDIDIEILGRDFTPRMDATVTALLTDSGGAVSERQLMPSVDDPGRYTGSIEADQPGPWQIEYRVLFPDGEELTRKAWFAVAATSPETRQSAFDEKTLRDIARITGGTYLSHEEAFGSGKLPVSPSIPTIEDRFHWTRSWPFLLTALLLFLLEWWLRRRHGLR